MTPHDLDMVEIELATKHGKRVRLELAKLGLVVRWQLEYVARSLRRTPVALFNEGGGLKTIGFGFPSKVATFKDFEGSAYYADSQTVHLFPKIFKSAPPRGTLSEEELAFLGPEQLERVETELSSFYSREAFFGVATHELGHALFQEHLRIRDSSTYEALANLWSVLRYKQGERLCGIDLGPSGDPEFRRGYQAGDFHEFLAEIYMLYILHPERLRQHVTQTGRIAKTHWDEVWEILERVLNPWH